ncbi:hypothetical protein L0F51_04055 [Afifella sp. H1R]|uniref:hypothetical protein n=1 Tax=Afifella sp. H1R TaxID=2908841 RepID=UPI001F30F72B|nr:hypothetical protein [Afifella sp. H1R]MCF1502938.1 hypothetical protein [Afifella sp. H1R]
MSGSGRVTLTLAFHDFSDKAFFVSETGIAERGVWLPRSQCRFDDLNRDKVEAWEAANEALPRRVRDEAVITVRVSEFIAKDRGLI